MKLILNSNAILHQTELAYLIQLPNTKLAFWHPCRFCNFSGKKGYKLSIWVSNGDWRIKVNRTSDKTRAVLETWTGSVSEAAEKFNLKIEN